MNRENGSDESHYIVKGLITAPESTFGGVKWWSMAS